jgi:hypothetical protein
MKIFQNSPPLELSFNILTGRKKSTSFFKRHWAIFRREKISKDISSGGENLVQSFLERKA